MSVIARAVSLDEAFIAATQRREEFGASAVTDSWLSEFCQHNPQVCSEVKSLLLHLDKAGNDDGRRSGFLNPAELHGSRAEPLHRDAELEEWGGAAVGQRVGDFVIIGQLGVGGMGVVYVAEQQRPRRTVALKVIKRSVSTPAMITRFEREAELLGRLSHRGIAEIYAAGIAEVRTADGQQLRVPYIAMEQIHGTQILEHCRLHRCSLQEIVALVIQVCEAIEHAHRRGVIHRDLKPANLLVARDLSAYSVKVLDFGVARAVGGQPTEETLTRLTGQGHLVGTPAYMSPEQIAGRADDVGPAADVYAIAAVLFQMVTGRHAIDVTDCPLPEIARRVVESVPPRLGTIDRRLRGDFETIVAKALEKDPRRRYPSAAALGEDLQNYLDGNTINAKADVWSDPYMKIVIRHRMALIIGTIAAIGCFALGWISHNLFDR